ncbi:MAG: hypothetical protein PHV20_08245 [Bacteroidales bacterium]|nr:hypothetical protein [Bacteroidales bacterium]
MKRFFAVILSLFILVLIAVPCIDKHESASHNTELSKDTSHQHQSSEDECSPFCNCVCCASPVIHSTTILHLTDFHFIQKYTTIYPSNFKSSLFASIWQPPKLN